MKSQLNGKDLDAGKDWQQEEKGAADNEMVRWHHQLNGHEFEQTPGDSEGQRCLMCHSPGHKVSDTTYQLNNNNYHKFQYLPDISFSLNRLILKTDKKQRDYSRQVDTSISPPLAH